MSLLKTNMEDLVHNSTMNAKADAKSTMKNKEDDLVSEPERKKDDGGAQDNIDKAAMGGKPIHQEGGVERLRLRQDGTYIVRDSKGNVLIDTALESIDESTDIAVKESLHEALGFSEQELTDLLNNNL